jgi:hypothetical protein
MSGFAELQRAYLNTTYWVQARPEPIGFRIGERNRALDRLLSARQVQHWAFVTAWNPGSRRVRTLHNVARQARLLRELKSQGYKWLDALGQSDGDDWPAEPSVLVFGMHVHQALRLGRRFGQHAVVTGKRGGKPILCWCAKRTAAHALSQRGRHSA